MTAGAAADNFDTLDQLAAACRKTHLSAVKENAKHVKQLKLIRNKVITIAELTTDVTMSKFVGDRIRDLCMQILSQSQ